MILTHLVLHLLHLAIGVLLVLLGGVVEVGAQHLLPAREPDELYGDTGDDEDDEDEDVKRGTGLVLL